MRKSPISNLQSLIPVLTILLLCSVAIAPLLHADTPCTHDGGLHYFRVVAMRHALQDGILFTRYLPDLAFGYGFPFFNYRAATSYYLALALHLAGLALPAALNAVYVIGILGSAVAAYLLARDLFGPRAGLVAAVAYAYAPYQFLNALTRGNAPESLALPLLPLILWAFRRLVLTGERRWFLLSTGSLTALYLTHNISSLIFTPLLVAYLLVLGLVHRRKGHWVAAGGALVLALGLAAFFLGPALLERGYVQLHQSRNNRNNDFHYNFMGLAELLALPAPVDTSLMNPPMQIHLGLVQVVLAGIGLVAGLVRRDREGRAMVVFLALAAAAMLWMSTGTSLWLWEHLPLLPFVQFPWRFVGRAALPIALLAGAAIPAAAPRASQAKHHPSRFTFHASRFTFLLAIATLILAAFPDTYPPHGRCPKSPYPTIVDLFAYERRSKSVGVDPTGSYFPVWVKQRPTGSPLEEQYAAGGPVARLDETALPAGTSVVEADYGPNQARVVVDAPAPFRARYLAFYFPGWQVTVDGEPVDVTPTDPEGFISFDVPAGHHTLAVRFGETELRLAADAISLLSLTVLLVAALRYTRTADGPAPSAGRLPRDPARLVVHGSLLVLTLLSLALKLTVVDGADTLFRHPTLRPDGTLPGVERPLDRRYADGLTLIGYGQSHTSLPADGTLRLDLYLTAYAQPAGRYQSVVHLVRPDGLRWSHPDSFRPRGYAKYPSTRAWTPGRYALDSHEVEPLPGTPPGTYDVVLTVFNRDTLAPLSVLNEEGQPAAPELVLGQVILTRPHRAAELPEEDRVDAALDDVTLLVADFDRDRAAPGDPVMLVTFWRAERQPAEDLTLRLTLLAPDGSAAAEYDLPPTLPGHPTSSWQPGDVWRGQHVFHLPADLESGDHTWRVSLLPTGQSADLRATIHVSAPPHTFTRPPVDVELGTRLGSVATLVGANVDPDQSTDLPATGLPIYPSSPLTVTLVWRAEETPTTSYHVFLHLLDPEGGLVAQSDGVPAGWTRPTTGWLPGEHVADVHTLIIPADTPGGEYTLRAGLYNPGSGTRLTDPTGADAIRVTTITVAER